MFLYLRILYAYIYVSLIGNDPFGRF